MIDLYTDKKVSPAGQVNKTDLKQVLHNMLVFLAPLGIVYLLQVSGALQNHSLNFNDLIPTQVTYGAIELYVVNTVTDLLRKFTNSNE